MPRISNEEFVTINRKQLTTLRDYLDKLLNKPQKPRNLVVKIVDEIFGINSLQAGRVGEIVDGKHAVRTLLYKYTTMTMRQIVDYMDDTKGKGAHVVTNSLKQVKNLLETSDDFKTKYDECVKQILELRSQ